MDLTHDAAALTLHRTNWHRSWNFLEIGVDKIMNHLRDGIDLKTYMSLYTAIHNFCTAQKAVGQTTNLHATHRGGQSNHHPTGLYALAS